MSRSRAFLIVIAVGSVALVWAAFPSGGGAIIAVPQSDSRTTAPLPRDARITAVWLEGPMEVRLRVDQAPDAETVAQWRRSVIWYRERAEGGTEFAFPVAAVEPCEGTKERVWRLAVNPLPGRGWYRWMVESDPPAPADATTFVAQGWTASWFGPEELDLPMWSTWLPDFNPHVFDPHLEALGLTQAWRDRFRQPGRLELHAVTFAPLAGLAVQADRPFSLTVGFATDPILSQPDPDNTSQEQQGPIHRVQIALDEPHDPANGPRDVTLAFQTGAEPGSGSNAPPRLLVLEPRWKNKDDGPDPTKTPLWLPPWVADASPSTIRAEEDPEAVAAQTIPFDLNGGDPQRGRLVFWDEEAKCAVCHQVGGEGGAIGPALDRPELARFDQAWWYRQIAEPSAVIAPNVRTHVAQLADGRVLSGVVRVVDFQTLTLAGHDGTIETLNRDDLTALNASSSSTMPSGLTGALGQQRLRDLLAFLMDAARRSQSLP